MRPIDQYRLRETRRSFLGRCACGVGSVALASLINPALLAAASSSTQASTRPSSATRWPGAVHPLHVPPKAKRVIHLYMAGGPSHLETFDYKPALAKLSGEPMPDS